MVLSRRGYSVIRPNLYSIFEKFPNRIVKSDLKTRDCLIEPEGDGMRLELNGGIGCNPHPSVTKCIAFSYDVQELHYYIDLVASGIDPWVLDFVRPKIRVTQKVSHYYTIDCRRAYARLSARLEPARKFMDHLSWYETKRNKMDCKSYFDRFDQADLNWSDLTVELDEYPSGMRHLIVQNLGGGGERCEVPTFRGPKFANLEIQAILPEEPILKPYFTEPLTNLVAVNSRPK
ncbi:unnamed protein product [Caenorhabditis sp. 36 PRJEB53466]|nr:unnamed protein product [Caenorhabditis sp. 36 PRJEB53466]